VTVGSSCQIPSDPIAIVPIPSASPTDAKLEVDRGWIEQSVKTEATSLYAIFSNLGKKTRAEDFEKLEKLADRINILAKEWKEETDALVKERQKIKEEWEKNTQNEKDKWEKEMKNERDEWEKDMQNERDEWAKERQKEREQDREEWEKEMQDEREERAMERQKEREEWARYQDEVDASISSLKEGVLDVQKKIKGLRNQMGHVHEDLGYKGV